MTPKEEKEFLAAVMARSAEARRRLLNLGDLFPEPGTQERGRFNQDYMPAIYSLPVTSDAGQRLSRSLNVGEPD